MISFEAAETPVCTEIIRQPSPPAVLAEVQDLIPAMSPQVAEVEHKVELSSPDDVVRSESPLQLHIVSFLTTLSLCLLCFTSFVSLSLRYLSEDTKFYC